MSADNRICIMPDQYGEWCVWEGALSAEYSEPPEQSERFDTREFAEAHAVRIAAGCAILEGGIQTITRDEQLRALSAQISDLSKRLDSLLVNGTQWETPNERA